MAGLDEQKLLSSQLFGVFPQQKNDPSQSANPCDPNTSQFQDPFGTAMAAVNLQGRLTRKTTLARPPWFLWTLPKWLMRRPCEVLM